MKRDEDMGLLKRTALKILTVLQEATIKQDNLDIYRLLTKLHFRLYFGEKLALDAEPRSISAAANRHANMVVVILFPNSSPSAQEYIHATATNVFVKNLLLEVDIENLQ